LVDWSRTNQPINQSTYQPINQSTNQPINQSTMNQIIARRQQTIFDVALQQYGGLEGGLLRLMTDNPAALSSTGEWPVGVFTWSLTNGYTVHKSIQERMMAVVPISGWKEDALDLYWALDEEAGVSADGEAWTTDVESGVSNGETWTTDK
jgi:hypothetical protein